MATRIEGDYEWDERKNDANISKHALGFSEAITIFESVVFERGAHRHGEERVIAIGRLPVSREVVVVYTNRHARKRIISARRAKKHERQTYQAFLQTLDDLA